MSINAIVNSINETMLKNDAEKDKLLKDIFATYPIIEYVEDFIKKDIRSLESIGFGFGVFKFKSINGKEIIININGTIPTLKVLTDFYKYTENQLIETEATIDEMDWDAEKGIVFTYNEGEFFRSAYCEDKHMFYNMYGGKKRFHNIKQDFPGWGHRKAIDISNIDYAVYLDLFRLFFDKSLIAPNIIDFRKIFPIINEAKECYERTHSEHHVELIVTNSKYIDVDFLINSKDFRSIPMSIHIDPNEIHIKTRDNDYKLDALFFEDYKEIIYKEFKKIIKNKM